MSGSHLFYNGVLFRDCETSEFIQTIEMDSNGIDPLFSRFRITVKSRVMALSTSLITANPAHLEGHDSAIRVPSHTIASPEAVQDDRTASDRLGIIRARMQEVRKDFWLATHGNTKTIPANNVPTEYSPATAADAYRIVLAATGEYSLDGSYAGALPEFIRGFNTDVTNAKRIDHIDYANGPRCHSVSHRIIGGICLEVQATFEICVCLCRNLDSGATPPVRDAAKVVGVISNRWSVAETLDKDFRSSHLIEGTLIVSDHRYKAQAYRTMVHPTLFPYARLESREFTQDPSGLKLGYRFAIVESGAAPPPGVVDWDGDYREELSGQTASLSYGTISAMVVGSIKRPPGQTAQKQKQVLINMLYRIFLSRISGINMKWAALPGQQGRGVILQSFSIAENMKTPFMRLSARVAYNGVEIPKDANEAQRAALAANPANLNRVAWNMRLGNMGRPLDVPGYDEKLWPFPDFFQWDTVGENAKTPGVLGSYFDMYSQSPCNLWHGMPRNAKTDQITLAERITGTPIVNGSFSVPFVTYKVADLNGTVHDIDTRPTPVADYFGVDTAIQATGFPYLQWDSDVEYDVATGVIQIPLSTRRRNQTGVAIRLHAPTAQRVFRVIASRQGAPPQMPAPMFRYTDTSTGIVEDLIGIAKVVADTPKLHSDGVTMIYSAQTEWRYAMSRPPAMNDYTGEAVSAYNYDALRTGSSPMDRTRPSDNLLPLATFFERTGIIDNAAT